MLTEIIGFSGLQRFSFLSVIIKKFCLDSEISVCDFLIITWDRKIVMAAGPV